MMESILFYLLAAMVLVPAILVVTSKNIFHCALWLIVSLSAVSGLYAMLAADFLFAVQLLVYSGGIMVVLLFVVLLSGRPSDWKIAQVNEKAAGAVLFILLLVGILLSALSAWRPLLKIAPPQPTTGALGQLLLNQMVLPFEVISLVLVASLVGAIYFSSKRPS